MSKLLKYAILANVVLVLLFALANYAVYVGVNREGYFTRTWSPFEFATDSYEAIPAPYTIIPNYPFYVFWVAIALNIFFMLRIQTHNETKNISKEGQA